MTNDDPVTREEFEALSPEEKKRAIEAFIKGATDEMLFADPTPLGVRGMVALMLEAYAVRLRDPMLPIQGFTLSWAAASPYVLDAREALLPEKPAEFIQMTFVRTEPAP